MSPDAQADALRFEPGMETPAADEAATEAALVATLTGISETVFRDTGRAARSVHAKSHGVLRGRLTVVDGVPAALAQGLFAQPGNYDLAMRFSTIPGDILDDDISTPRGLALKVIGVSGERLPGSEDASTQDFVLVNAPAFGALDAKTFLGSLKLVAATTDRAPGLKKGLSAVARATESLLEAFGRKSGLILALGGQPLTHILGETFYSQVPILYGVHVAKVAVAPASPELTALAGQKLDLKGKPDGLRDAVVAFFAERGGVWELRVQLCTDLKSMPIEDASVVWPEELSPYVTVARIEVPAQSAWSEAARAEIDDGLAFSPWHGLAAHRPLGAVMRARRKTYASSADYRSSRNHCPIREPNLR